MLTSLGWLIALPIGVGVVAGHFIDGRLGAGSFWTLTLLGAGIFVGAWNAYLGIRRALVGKHHD